eukprot:2776404-Amphidinium_carterae.1
MAATREQCEQKRSVYISQYADHLEAAEKLERSANPFQIDNDFESRLLIFKYFGTFGRMMVCEKRPGNNSQHPDRLVDNP